MSTDARRMLFTRALLRAQHAQQQAGEEIAGYMDALRRLQEEDANDPDRQPR